MKESLPSAQREFEGKLGHALIAKQEFIRDLRNAITRGTGYAAGKIGVSERAWMYYPIVLERESDPLKRRAYEASLKFKTLRQSGIFPARAEFCFRFAQVYIEHVRNLDVLGICLDARVQELELIRWYQLTNKLIYFQDQEPDRSTPNDDANCYLPFFRDKRILLICPFAELLRERATRDTFESVWSKTGKKWFYPQSVEALEFPYGFARDTQQKYSTALDLLQEITSEIERCDFDIALIAAGGLGIPLASFVKRRGQVAISLGGHLQVLFGVLGERWRNRKTWQQEYFNESWIDMPARYKPNAGDTYENYW